MSQARLGELVGRSASTVRAWERGSSWPTEPGVVTALAAALDLEEANLFRASGLEPPADAPPPTIEQALQTIAPDGDSGSGASASDGAEEAGSRSNPPLVPAGSPTSRERGRRVRERRPSPPPVTVSPPTVGWQVAEPSYLEDPEQKLVYRLRWVYTLAGLLFLLIVLVWASGRMLEAVGDVLDGLKASIGG